MRKENIRNNVQQYRKWKGLTQKEFAEEIDISIPGLRAIESQKVSPKPGLRFRICRFFDVRHDQMFHKPTD